MISPQLFQPPAILDPVFANLVNTTPHWPSLTTYSADFSVVHPSGSWYFVRHPDNPVPLDFVVPLERELEWERGKHLFRTYPDDKAMNALLGAAGKARHNMPALQMMSLIAKLEDRDGSHFEAVWLKAGQKQHLDDGYTEQPVEVGIEAVLRDDHVYWWTGKGCDWRPKREVEEVWVGDGNQQWYNG